MLIIQKKIADIFWTIKLQSYYGFLNNLNSRFS